MRRVTNTNLLFWIYLIKALTEHFLQGNVPLRHLLNAKPPFMSWRRSAINDLNDWDLGMYRYTLYPGMKKPQNWFSHISTKYSLPWERFLLNPTSIHKIVRIIIGRVRLLLMFNSWELDGSYSHRNFDLLFWILYALIYVKR